MISSDSPSINDGYDAWFTSLTGFPPHPWQSEVASESRCIDRLLRIPTGFGKTAGTVLSWVWHRAMQNDERWPLRIVFCLPMRVLVEQTEIAIRGWLERAGLINTVGLHVLMGGVEAQPWALDPERPAILVGTQDMLLSRALNRGYGAARGRWPMEYGLLNVDTLWVMDEVQIMGVGLATSVQLAAFRNAEQRAGRMPRATACWWMSATLQPRWLETVDFEAEARVLAGDLVSIPAALRVGGLWEVSKSVDHEPSVATPDEVAQLAAARHQVGALSLVVVNTVRRAIEVREALARRYAPKGKRPAGDAPELCLVHSRFRGAERARWAKEFLSREAQRGTAGRIIIATQVIEAGVDISAQLLITDLAPWPSLVQRFGRVARYVGETGTIVVVGPPPADDKAALPYNAANLAASAAAIARLRQQGLDGAPRGLEAFEDHLRADHPEILAGLYPYEPGQVFRRTDLDELFDTTPDLSGSDLDISVFIRAGEERDVSVFWRTVDEDRIPGRALAPRREELCPVPVHELREWFKKFKNPDDRPLVLDYIDGVWQRRSPERIVPGMTVLVASRLGGYDLSLGWSPNSAQANAVVAPVVAQDLFTQTAEVEDSDDLSIAPWKSIASHGREARDLVRTIAGELGLSADLVACLELAARWHDAGKAHDVFQRAIRDAARVADGMLDRRDLAKAPDNAWVRPSPYPDRPGFRHELVSTLMLFEVLRRTQADHPALLGGAFEVLAAIGMKADAVAPEDVIAPAHPLARELVALTTEEFDLVAWLVCTHHGKVRTSWSSTVLDQDKGHGGIHGVTDGDHIAALALVTTTDEVANLPRTELSLGLAALGIGTRYGRSWTERASLLAERVGCFQLAWLEAILRTADVRSSMLSTKDPLL
ncbi:MAG: DEAD/DEAH box helicase [Proteobacteria bacterium]|nr:DEAD/DEAH box helicase [Pseudomonadota bacterium]